MEGNTRAYKPVWGLGDLTHGYWQRLRAGLHRWRLTEGDDVCHDESDQCIGRHWITPSEFLI
jgi:hypothetical protein